MRAAVCRALNQIAVEDIDDPTPSVGEVKIKIAAVGVCHTDLSMLQGHLPVQFPIVLGHEGAGVVTEVGPQVRDLRVGDHVVCSIIGYCGQCWYCSRGEFPLCDQTTFFTGKMLDGTTRLSKGGEAISSLHFQASFAEYAVVPERFVVKIRDDAPLDKMCGFACGLSTGMGAAMVRADVTPGSSVLVIGAGGVGCSAMIGARAKGATTILAVDIAETKLRNVMARGLATHVVNPAEDDLLRVAAGLTGGRGVDFAFDAVGAPGTLESAIEATRPGGHIVVIGRADHSIAVTTPTSQLLRHKTLTGTFGGSITPKRHIPEFVDLYMQGRLDLDALFDKTYTLDEIATAMDDLHHGRMTRGVVLL
jgi:S-(hydroxymethyl)glutathione dehydrogenase / alcohol dehydrogenase